MGQFRAGASQKGQVFVAARDRQRGLEPPLQGEQARGQHGEEGEQEQGGEHQVVAELLHVGDEILIRFQHHQVALFPQGEREVQGLEMHAVDFGQRREHGPILARRGGEQGRVHQVGPDLLAAADQILAAGVHRARGIRDHGAFQARWRA